MTAVRACACRCLGQETPSILGQGLDELMRHVPQLRSAAIDVVVTILHRLHAMGKGQSAPEGPPRSSPGEGGDAGGDSTMADNREAGGQSAAGEAAEEVNSAQPSAMDVDGMAGLCLGRDGADGPKSMLDMCLIP